MYWYKVKNVLIVLFALINVFLIGAIVIGNAQKNREEQRMSESLVKVLENSNIKIDAAIINAKAPELKTRQIENCVSGDISFANLVLDGSAKIRYDDNGVLYYEYEGDKLYLTNGRLHYYKNGFQGVGSVSRASLEAAKKFLEKIGVPTEDYREEINEDTVVLRLYIDGAPLFGSSLNIKMDGDTVGEMWGYIVKNTAYSGTFAKTRSAADVIFEFLRDPNRGTGGTSVLALELGYSILAQDSDVDFKTADAYPTYRMTLSDGRVFYYDARKK